LFLRSKARALQFCIGCLACLVSGAFSLTAQAPPAERRAATSEQTMALFLSDVHFDPFHDPQKAALLIRSPANEWASILRSPDSAGQEQSFEDLQRTCRAGGVDTDFALLGSSVEALRASASDAQFAVLTGDLIAHNFSCRFKTLSPKATDEDYEKFVVKTMEFLIATLRKAVPGRPIYIALGNNDSACGDYRLDENSGFLRDVSKVIASALPPDIAADTLLSSPKGGYYSVPMAAPMRNTRLIVLNDLFLSPRYETCGGASAPALSQGETDWLRGELQTAREHKEKAWIIGHIPPGVNVYATISKFKDVCAGNAAELFLVPGEMDDLLSSYADVVQLGLFAHTHMDEMRVLSSGAGLSVPLKLVPSISPVDGNNPSFVIARINTTTARLRDYSVVVASNQTGIATKWALEYDYHDAYHEPDFSGKAVRELVERFRADPQARSSESQDYIRYYFKGEQSLALTPFWSQYSCSLGNMTTEAYADCVCSSVKK
jgi:sphingomyelin phosphodiesterase acid-like 3